MPDIPYNREEGRKKYLSIAKHQSTARNRYAKWININIERDLFDYADYGNYTKTVGDDSISWLCAEGNMWALQIDRSSVGLSKEQFGFFQRPANINDEWHGFPIIPFSNSRYSISEDLLLRWCNDGIITYDDIPAIISKRRI